MDLKTLRKLYNACNPDEPLDPNDPRNVDVDALGDAENRVRGENWVGRLAFQIELSSSPVCKLFTGLRGSGKSTEIRRLAARLRDPKGAHLLPVIVDADENLDLSAEVDVPDVLAPIVYRAEEEVLKAEKRDPEDALKDGWGKRLWTWLTNRDIHLESAEIGIHAGVVEGKLAAEMKQRPTLRQRIRAIVAASPAGFLKEVRSELEKLNQRAKEVGHTGIVIIFDSLEKLQGMMTNWENVIQSAHSLFSNDAPHLTLPVHALYTIPPALVLRLKTDVHFMPMMKLHHKTGLPYPPGLLAAREMVRRRIPDEHIEEVFGKDPEKRVTELIGWSGGYPRELIRLLQSVLEVEELPVRKSALDRVFSRTAEQYRRIVLASGAFDWLATVAVHRALLLDSEAQHSSADRMLSNNVVLRYLNKDEWFELHPAIRDLEQVQQAITRLKAQLGSAGGGAT